MLSETEFLDAKAALDRAIKSRDENEFSGVSALWESFFQSRKSTSDFESIKNFLSEDNDSAYGVAIKIPANLKSIYRKFYEELFRDEAIPPMRQVGNPTSLAAGGRFADVAYLQNYTRTRQILALAKRFDRPVHVLEIGAGYGGVAQQLIEAGVAESYTIVDLPNNLLLSDFYLRSIFPERRANTCDNFSFGNSINFLIPQQIQDISNRRFDIVINCDSFGEMPAETARAYLKFISTALSDEGFVYSKNGHRRSKGAIAKVSDYGYDLFDMLSLKPTPFPSLIFDHHHHVAILGKKTTRPAIDANDLDTFCELSRSGIHGEIVQIGDRITANAKTSDDEKFLAAVREIYAGNLTEWRPSDPDLTAALDYLNGIELLNRGDRASRLLLERYIPASKSSAAEAISIFGLSEMGNPISFTHEFTNGVGTEFLLRTMKLDPTRYFQRKLLWGLRKPMVNAVTRPYVDQGMSLLVMAKNIFLNIRSGRGLSVERLT